VGVRARPAEAARIFAHQAITDVSGPEANLGFSATKRVRRCASLRVALWSPRLIETRYRTPKIATTLMEQISVLCASSLIVNRENRPAYVVSQALAYSSRS
jgi:hypothetical protein